MKKILFIDTNQYGSLIDSLKWCELLGNEYSIKYISFDNGNKKTVTPNIKTIYVPQLKPKALRGFVFLFCAFINCIFFKGRIFVIYHEKLDILKKLMPWKKMHLDIRTLCVSDNKKVRDYQDEMLRKSAMTFDTVSAISKGVIRKLNIHRNISLLPLGADAISNTDKEFTAIHLLYIGTMTNRHIPQTIEGLSMYLTKNPHAKITYDIVGGDNGEGELKHVEEVVKKYGLGEYIRVHGPKPHNELKPFLDNCNVGISYVPITDYFQYQPPTKTYEYAFSGLATIATATFANSEIINDTNGIIIKDTPEDFCQGLEKIKSLKFNSKLIRQSVSKFSWKNIVSKYLVPIIEQQSV